MEQIRITEETLKLNVGGKLRPFSKGDVVSVGNGPTQLEPGIAETCLKFGWAEDVDGVEPTGERKPGASGEVMPDTVTLDQGAE